MRKRLFKLPALVVSIGMLSTAIIVFAQGDSEVVEKTLTSKAEGFEIVEDIEELTATPTLTPTPTQKVEPETPAKESEDSYYPRFSYSKDWDYEDSYLLAKIAMAEAEGENLQTKTLVILTVLNRVHSDEFPNTIHDVIFQYNSEKDVYQFSPVMPGGRWWTTEPNDDCWEAVRVVREAQYDYSGGALYFESCDYDSWHSRNLTFLYQSGNMKFYE